MKYLQLLKSKEVITFIITLLAGVFAKELGLSQYISNQAAMGIVGVSLGVLGYILKETFLADEAEEILEPSFDTALTALEHFIEKRYAVQIPDNIKMELLKAIFGDDLEGF